MDLATVIFPESNSVPFKTILQPFCWLNFSSDLIGFNFKLCSDCLILNDAIFVLFGKARH